MTDQPQEMDDEKSATLVKELLLEVQSAAYGHATSYTTIVVFGGYASLFTIWTYTKDYLSKETTYRVAIMLGSSVLLFVLFEIFKMVIVSYEMMKVRALLVNQFPPAVLLAKRAALARNSKLFVQRIVVPTWIIVLIVTIITGFGAAFLLLGAFASYLAFPAEIGSSPS